MEYVVTHKIQEKLKRFNDGDPVALSIEEIAAWRMGNEGSRLLLPPIQRSVVWSNEQIINYWDSLLRGFPPGMMMVHHVVKTSDEASRKGLDAEGRTRDVSENDYQLFDGQQRVAAVLLGFGEGQHKANRKLWVDIGVPIKRGSGLKFQLRITTPGQPFGYRPDAPNQKIELSKRQEKWGEWKGGREEAFTSVQGKDLIDAKCAIPLHEFIAARGKWLDAQADGNTVDELISALDKALHSKVILQLVPREIVMAPDEYIRFFERVGQGGSRLSDDELTYSIIKHQLPEIRNRVEDVMQKVGRLSDEIDIVLAALRVARASTVRDGPEWSIIGRPNPAFVSELRDGKQVSVRQRFLALFGLNDSQEPESELLRRLLGLRDALAYDNTKNPTGLPAILLARLPNGLVDVLLLFSVKKKSEAWLPADGKLLIAFVLHWLFFVGQDDKAAWEAYRQAKNNEWCFGRESVGKLIADFQREDTSNPLPSHEQIAKLRRRVDERPQNLNAWAERFTGADDDKHRPGDALRNLSTNREKIMRALLWLQRGYISERFPNYDPTSGRDEDLPIDLDHIVPQAAFGFTWSDRKGRLDEAFHTDNFRHQRSLVGNSLGNFRWISSTENRSRQHGKFESLGAEVDFVTGSDDEWNSLNPGVDGSQKQWGKDEVARFQYLIDQRTLYLYERLVKDSGIEAEGLIRDQ